MYLLLLLETFQTTWQANTWTSVDEGVLASGKVFGAADMEPSESYLRAFNDKELLNAF